MHRDEAIAKIHKACVKANNDLWVDHGNVLKRRFALGMAVPTRLGLADVLLALQAVYARRSSGAEQDHDLAHLGREARHQVVDCWNVAKDDIDDQADACSRWSPAYCYDRLLRLY